MAREPPVSHLPGDAGRLAIEVSHLSKRFGFTLALDDVSIRLPQGNALLIVGPNGSGKSTLLKVLCGILRRPRGSLVRVLGIDPWRQRHILFSRATAAFEDYAFPELASGEDYLKFVAKLRGVPIDRNIGGLMGIEDFWSKSIRGYSSGMKRKLALAQAFVGRPELIVLDEPLVALDRQSKDQLIEVLAQRRAAGTTLVICSHILIGLERIATRMVVLVNGKMTYESDISDSSGPLEEIYRRILEST
ncbi:MAG: ATP-binding cassette domain-containing protein [Conexivisphaerales archaeon]